MRADNTVGNLLIPNVEETKDMQCQSVLWSIYGTKCVNFKWMVKVVKQRCEKLIMELISSTTLPL